MSRIRAIFDVMKNRKKPTEDELRSAFPCLFARLVPIEKVRFNDYNPNAVPPPEMRLLRHSIEEDGYTQPIVTVYDPERDEYVVVDGAHRYKNAAQVFKLPVIPVVVIDKPIRDRMASTIRHNRARGEHAVTPMSNIVAELYRLGWEDAEIGKQLGMEPDEVLRLKQVTGLAELFVDGDYSQAWEVCGDEDESESDEA